MTEILNATNAAIGGQEHPKLRLYSAHENNVAALMAAARVFKPHQPKYGATFSIELRRSHSTGQFYITVSFGELLSDWLVFLCCFAKYMNMLGWLCSHLCTYAK